MPAPLARDCSFVRTLNAAAVVCALLLSGPSTRVNAGPPVALSVRQSQQGNASAPEVIRLELGKAVERELAGGQEHGYQVTLSENQYANIRVEQRGIDVIVNVRGPDGKPLSSFDSEIRSQGPEQVELVAESAGAYRVVVQAKRPRMPAGKYEVRLSEIRTASDADRSLQEARKLILQSDAFFSAGKFDPALPLVEKALEIRERLLGQEHAEVASIVGYLAEIYRRKGDFAKAEPLFQRAIKIREDKLGPDHPAVATTLTYLGEVYRFKGEYAIAESVHRRALAIREKAFGQEHPDVAISLSYLGLLHYSTSDFGQAESLLQRALDIWMKTVGPSHPSTANTLNSLGLVYSDTGDYTRAIPTLERALDVWEKSLGPEHPNVAAALINLARISRAKGEFDKAEQFYQRALDIYMKRAPEHPDVATVLNNIAIVHRERGDYDKAEQLYLRALEIYKKALGAEHPLVASSLSNLANLYELKGEFDKADPLQERALVIRQKALPPGHPDIGSSTLNVAGIRRRRGDLDGAEQMYKQALDIWEKTLGPDHNLVSHALHGLAWLAAQKGDYARAEPLYRRAQEIREKALGPDHPDVADLLGELAMLEASKGDIAGAVNAQSRANRISEHNIALNLVTGSERQKLAYLATLSDVTDKTLSLQCTLAPNDSRASALGVTTVLQRKGRVLDALADSLTALRRRFNPEDQKLLDQLNDTLGRLATLVLSGPQRMSTEQHRKDIGALEERREQLEAEIGRRSAGSYGRSGPITLGDVQSAIPDHASLIEFEVYRPYDPKEALSGAVDSKPFGEPRYVAYVIGNRGEVRWRDLGLAREIDDAVGRLRLALRDPRSRDAREVARVLDARIMEPIRPLLGDATNLLISPDGALNLIPFEALVDDQNRYLVERFSCTYLTSGRDLLRMQVQRASKSGPVVLADPSFGEPEVAGSQQEQPPNSKQAASVAKARMTRRQSVTSVSDLADVYFAPLSGTAQEAQAIKSLFAEASVLTGKQATESSLKQASAPLILHIATHGFFLTDTAATSNALERSTRAISANVKIANPLLRSGLALANANLHKHNDDDGILTSLEASGLNLWGTKLVTLSACDTGLGEVKNGEGVYGLRRAFVLSGTETLVMSLWPVSDYVTREMMGAYYKGLKQGLGRGDALRQVQLSMLKRKSRRHPFYWASFIQSGEWANLDGKR